jgi:uncharacterized SAM-binding protein YcdF (DUF218 family)
VIDFITWSKLTLRPSNISFLLLVLAIVTAVSFLRPRWGRRLLVAVLAGYWFVSTPIGSGLFIAPLVRGYQQLESAADARDARAVVVLGGGIHDLKVLSSVLAYPYETTTLRVFEAARVYRLLDSDEHLVMIASGGITSEGGQTSEASVIADALSRLGVPRERIVIEDSSMTTHEQAIRVTGLLRERGIVRFVIVTSPTHMARSLAAFRAAGADVVPSIAALLPESPRRPGLFVPNDDSFWISDNAFYDYAALVYYWSRGWLTPSRPETPR